MNQQAVLILVLEITSKLLRVAIVAPVDEALFVMLAAAQIDQYGIAARVENPPFADDLAVFAGKTVGDKSMPVMNGLVDGGFEPIGLTPLVSSR